MRGRKLCMNVVDIEKDLKVTKIDGVHYNDAISSVTIGEGVKAEVCRDRLGDGPCTVITESNDHMWLANDSISYIRVYRD